METFIFTQKGIYHEHRQYAQGPKRVIGLARGPLVNYAANKMVPAVIYGDNKDPLTDRS